MKSSEKLNRLIGEIDDKLILEADNYTNEQHVIQYTPLRGQFTGLIAAALILVAGTVFMFHSLAPDDPPVSRSETTPVTSTASRTNSTGKQSQTIPPQAATEPPVVTAVVTETDGTVMTNGTSRTPSPTDDTVRTNGTARTPSPTDETVRTTSPTVAPQPTITTPHIICSLPTTTRRIVTEPPRTTTTPPQTATTPQVTIRVPQPFNGYRVTRIRNREGLRVIYTHEEFVQFATHLICNCPCGYNLNIGKLLQIYDKDYFLTNYLVIVDHGENIGTRYSVNSVSEDGDILIKFKRGLFDTFESFTIMIELDKNFSPNSFNVTLQKTSDDL